MVFTELRFLIFLLITILFFIFLKKYRKQVLFLSSIIFYIAWDYRFLVLLLFTAVFAFYIWKIINRVKTKKKYYLFLWIIVHLSILFATSYDWENLLSVLSICNIGCIGVIQLNLLLPTHLKNRLPVILFQRENCLPDWVL